MDLLVRISLFFSLSLIVVLPGSAIAIESVVTDRATLESKTRDILNTLHAQREKGHPTHGKYAPENEYLQELHILRAIEERSRAAANPPRATTLVSHEEDREEEEGGGHIETATQDGPTALAVGEFIKELRKKDEISRRDQVLIGLSLYSDVLKELVKLNWLGIYHIDNHGDNFIFTEKGVSIIDFGDSEDALAGKPYENKFPISKQLLQATTSEERLKIYQECETLYSSELLTGLLGIFDKGDTSFTLPRLLNRLKQENDIQPSCMAALRNTLELLATGKPAPKQVVTVEAMIYSINSVINTCLTGV